MQDWISFHYQTGFTFGIVGVHIVLKVHPLVEVSVNQLKGIHRIMEVCGGRATAVQSVSF
jgi:hypothetical protein